MGVWLKVSLIVVGRTARLPLRLAVIVTIGAALVGVTAGPALATDRPPRIQLLCSASANGGTIEAAMCVLPFGVTTAPNSYSATVAVSNPGAGDTFALVAGSLPPGLKMPAKSGSSTVITGNPIQTRHIPLYGQGDQSTGPHGHAGLLDHRHGTGSPRAAVV
jgi:hypothetical protein